MPRNVKRKPFDYVARALINAHVEQVLADQNLCSDGARDILVAAPLMPRFGIMKDCLPTIKIALERAHREFKPCLVAGIFPVVESHPAVIARNLSLGISELKPKLGRGRISI